MIIVCVYAPNTCNSYNSFPSIKTFPLDLVVYLIAIGFTTYIPHVMICATIPMDYASRKTAASAAGFIDSFGYSGASLTGVISGFLVDHYGWNAAFYFWVIGVFIAIVLMSIQWNYLPKKGEYH